MELTYSPQALPGSCYLCGSANRASYIDAGCSVEFHGAMYLCDTCIAEMSRMLGYIAREDYIKLQDNKDELERQVFVLGEKLSAVEESLRVLGNAGYQPRFVVDVDTIELDLPEDTPVSTFSSPSRKKAVGAGKGETPESSDDEGVGILHSDDELFADDADEL